MLGIDEAVAAGTAAKKVVDELYSNLRDEFDAEMLEAYEANGTSSRVLRFNGVEVGTANVVRGKDVWRVSDKREFDEFALLNGLADLRCSIAPGCEARAIEVLLEHAPELVADEAVMHPGWERGISNRGGVPYLGETMVPGLEYGGRSALHVAVRGVKPETVVPLVRSAGGFDRLLEEVTG